METKKKTFFALKLLAFTVALVLIMWAASPLFVPRWSTGADGRTGDIARGFFAEEKNTLDVIFLGNSNVYPAVSPAIISEISDTSSYVYAMGYQTVWVAYYLLYNMLDYQKPKAVFLDMDSAFTDEMYDDSYYRKAFDYVPLTAKKLETLSADVFDYSFTDILSYVFPIMRYKERVFELDSDCYKNYGKYELNESKGFYTSDASVAFTGDLNYMADNGETETMPEVVTEHLDKLVKLCEENGIKLVLMNIPVAGKTNSFWNLARHNAVASYAEEKSLTYIDFNLITDEIGIDWATDTYDGGIHLNKYGAEKISKYLANYIKSEIG